MTTATFAARGQARALAIATFGAALSMGVVGSGTFSIFMVPLQESFGWGRGDISVAHTIAVWIVAALSPFCGAAADRWGTRRVLLPALLGYGLALGSAAFLTGSILHLYLTYALVGLFGVGATGLLYTRVVVQWFTVRRGMALGIVMSGIGMGQMVLLPVVELVVISEGWRTAYLLVAAIILLLLWPICALWFYEPAERGSDYPCGPPSVGRDRISWRKILASRVFGQLATGFFALGLYTGGILVHLVPMLSDRGVAPGQIAAVLSIVGVTLFLSRIATGAALDRIDSRYVCSISLSLAVFGIFMLASGASGSTAIFAAALISFAIGAELDFMAFLVRQHFPLAVYGQAYGLLYGAMMIGAGCGPMLMGFAHQHLGDYSVALWSLCVIAAIGTALFARMPLAHPRDAVKRSI